MAGLSRSQTTVCQGSRGPRSRWIGTRSHRGVFCISPRKGPNPTLTKEAAAEALTKLHLEKFEDAPKVKAKPKRPRLLASPTPTKSKVMKVTLRLRVENNSKFVRGKKKARESIERPVLSRYGMEKERDGGYEYTLTIPYEPDEELDRIIYDEILREADRISDMRHRFIEGDATSVDDPDRSW